MTKDIIIGEKIIGTDRPCFIIAEGGVNHNGDPDKAFQLIDIAFEAGADAIKFQTFKTEKLVAKSAPMAKYQKHNTGMTDSQFNMLRQLELGYSLHKQLKHYANSKGLEFLSTPFDFDSLDFLEELAINAFKIGSGDLTNIPFLKAIAEKGKPIILSTGMSYLDEVRLAVNTIEEAGIKDLVLLHCTSNYPPAIEDTNLKAMLTLKDTFNVHCGYSDHTLGDTVAIGAVALGARVIEKHLTIDKNLPGPDHLVSLDPLEFKQMVTKIRMMEKALGTGEKVPVQAEQEIRMVAGKSIVARANIAKGKIIEQEDLTIKRPGNGIKPQDWNEVIGTKAKMDICEDQVLTWDMLEVKQCEK